MRNLAWLLPLLAACAVSETGTAPAPAADPQPDPPPAGAADQPGRKAAAGELIAFPVPKGWIEEEPVNRMRKAQYRVPDKEKVEKPGLFTLFHFRISTPVEDNIARWAGQMGGVEAKVETFEGKCRVTLADFQGIYQGDVVTDEIPDARMLAAIVEASDGNWYFKLVGPTATVSDWRPEYVEMLKAAHR